MYNKYNKYLNSKKYIFRSIIVRFASSTRTYFQYSSIFPLYRQLQVLVLIQSISLLYFILAGLYSGKYKQYCIFRLKRTVDLDDHALYITIPPACALYDAVKTPRSDVGYSLSPSPRSSVRTACARTQVTFGPATPAPASADRPMDTG